MKDFEVPFYQNYCVHCSSFSHCPWLSLSNETCLELSYYSEVSDESL